MKILYLLFSFLFLALQVSSEQGGRKHFVLVAGLSSPRREMFFCRGGSCHFGRCPIHMVKVGSCFGFRSCCKLPWNVREVDESFIEE
ncbi:Gallinacin-2 [Lonchura striata]|uniref:Gallinacin-2 n=1 Tax=Lonchura striata TaxID=40157 RepID=A0A218U8P0_9PASE|nr:Gallinacin-2 [Lonchura striata domestica]